MAERGNNKKALSGREPVFIIRPANKTFGLDYLHVSLIALVVILVALAFALSTFKQGVMITNCRYGVGNGSICNTTVHNSTQVLGAVGKTLAAYSSINTSLSLIPYYSLINQSKVEYLSSEREWLAVVPYKDPLANGAVFNISLVYYDSNLTLAGSYIQSIKPAYPTNNSVVSLGTVSLYGESACTTAKPMPVYTITDPYAPGAMNVLYTAINTSKRYKGDINMSYFFIFSGYSQQFYNGYGQQYTQQMGRYLYCASRQSNFTQFLSNLSTAYSGVPLTNLTLYQVSLGSKLDITQFNACMQNATRSLDYQSQFANLYHIISTPTIVVNCRYSTLPQTINYAINYSLRHLNG